MSYSGLTASVSGMDSITRKKIELYEGFSSVQLFFSDEPDLSRGICVLPVKMIPKYFSIAKPAAFLRPPALGFGPPEAMKLSIAAGCTDYLCSPWSPEEFFVRIVRCIDRGALRYGDACLFTADGEIACRRDDGMMRAVKLTRVEMIIMQAFSRNRGYYFSRQVISELISRRDDRDSRAVDMYIARLRRKIAQLCVDSDIPSGDSPIRTSTGCGWGIM